MPAKQKYHHGNLKPALIAAALRELAKHGIEGFSLRNVARRAGVSAPAVYRHFAAKDDLLVAIAIECGDRLAAAMAEAVARAPADPLEHFRAIGIAVVRFAVANPEHYRALSLPGLADRMPADYKARQSEMHAAQRRSLADAQARGLIADVPLDDLMLTAQCAINGLAREIIDGKLGDIDDARAAKLAVGVTHVLGCGFAPRATKPRR